jgi:hypothetical protein
VGDGAGLSEEVAQCGLGAGWEPIGEGWQGKDSEVRKHLESGEERHELGGEVADLGHRDPDKEFGFCSICGVSRSASF